MATGVIKAAASLSQINTLDTNKQNKTDNSLTTTDKTIVGAINEHQGKLNKITAGYYATAEDGMTEISSNADLDNILAPGNWICKSASTAATLSHTPVTNKPFVLHVEYVGNGLKQNVISVSNDIYTRYRQNGSGQSWSSWDSLALNSKLFNTLLSTTDFNSITNDGIYKFDWVSGGTTYNRPVNQGGQLITSTQGTVKMQIYSTSSGTLFVRGYHDNAWENWEQLALNSKIDGIEIPANANLNNYTTPGTYYCTSSANAQTILNKPSDFDIAFTMQVYRKSSTTYNQVVYAYGTNGGAAYVRTSTSAGWQPWFSYTYDINNKADVKALNLTNTISASSTAALKTALLTFVANNVNSDGVAAVVLKLTSGVTAPLYSGGWGATIQKASNNYFSLVCSNNYYPPVLIRYNNGDWFIDALVLNSNIGTSTRLFSGNSMTTEKTVYTLSENITNYLFAAIVVAWSNINITTGYYLIPTVKWVLNNSSDETRVYLNNNPANDYFSMYNRTANQINAKVSNTSVKVEIYGICKIA